MKSKILIYIFSASLLVTGCSVSKNYSFPNVASNITYHTAVKTDTADLVQWFQFYQDSFLQSLIKTALDSNKDLLIAGARIEEARAQSAIIKSNLYPELNYQAQYGGGHSGIDAQKARSGYDGKTINVYGTVNWEIDIWGKLRSASRSAQAALLSDVYNRDALKVSLIAEVAAQYFLLRDLDNRLNIAETTLVSRKEFTKLTTEKFEHGYISELDKLAAIQQESSVAATIPALKRQIVLTENSIRLLCGQTPGIVARDTSDFQQAYLPEIPVGLSSQLLERRPDIQSAQANLDAQFLQIKVAQANRLPTVSLTGFAGVASSQLRSLVNDNAVVANLFAGITGPVFNYNKLKNAVTVQEKRTEQTAYQYQQTVLSAFGDVDNALTIYKTYSDEYDQLRTQVDASEKALNLTNARYNHGFTSFLEVIVQQNNLVNAQLQESAALQGKLNALVTLYKSLGGGWEVKNLKHYVLRY